MIKAGIIGATGYTGVELLRILAGHPDVDVVVATSNSESGRRVDAVIPSLRGYMDLALVPHDHEALLDCDVVFFATPNATSMHRAPRLLENGCKVIDLSADFRLRDVATWAHWYGEPHACPERLEQAVYGLPEINRENIRTASLVANPGCYPTAIILGLLPALQNHLIDTTGLVADAKSGVSGAGRKVALSTQFSEAGESFTAYGVASGHRHHPEILQALTGINNQVEDVTFVPHLVPMIRGIHATLYAGSLTDGDAVQTCYENHFAREPFVDILPPGSHPDTKSVRGSNSCRIAVHQPGNGRRLIVLSVIDNLVKGAAGQAVHNMNIMYGLPETSGLMHIALSP